MFQKVSSTIGFIDGLDWADGLALPLFTRLYDRDRVPKISFH